MELLKMWFEMVATGCVLLAAVGAAFLTLSKVRAAMAGWFQQPKLELLKAGTVPILVLAYVLGAVSFPVAEDFFDKDWLGFRGDDAIKALVYGMRSAEVMPPRSPEALRLLTPNFEKLVEVCGGRSSESCCTKANGCQDAVKRIYNFHLSSVISAGGEPARIEREVKQQLFVVRGFALAMLFSIGTIVLICLCLGALALIPSTAFATARTEIRSMPFWMWGLRLAVAAMVLHYAGAYAVSELEHDYDNHVLRSYEAIIDADKAAAERKVPVEALKPKR
jgi:hypothetical protein